MMIPRGVEATGHKTMKSEQSGKKTFIYNCIRMIL